MTDSACLDDNSVAALLDGSLPGAARRAAEIHVDACAGCRELIAGLAGRFSAFATSANSQGNSQGNSQADTQADTARAPDRQVKSWVSTMPSEPTAAARLLEAGEMIEQLCVEHLIGRGGMGEVYLARDTRLDRPVAVKIVSHVHLDSDRTRERFLTEARTTARLNHPNIVTVHSVGEHEGRPYLALEYIRGRTLRRWDGEVMEGVRIALAVAEALVEAHRHGVFHRDLKPENVLIGDDGRVRVVDFGLAMTAEIGDDARFTGVAGTPRYMAPEQWTGAALDGAVDVWALGVMLYELVADGRHPCVTGSQPSRLDLAAATAAHIESIAPLPDDRRSPPALRRLIHRCLAPSSAARPSAEEVRDELAALVAPARATGAGWLKLGLAMASGALVVAVVAWLVPGGASRAAALQMGASATSPPLARASTPPPAEAPPAEAPAPPVAASGSAPKRTAAPRQASPKPAPSQGADELLRKF